MYVERRFCALNLSIRANLVPTFAISMSRLAPEAYFNQDSSTFSISKVHRLLFALAMNGILSTGNRTPVEALKVTRSKFTLTVLKPLVIIVQAFLGICVVCVALLLLLLKRKPSNLLTNPASLSDLAALLPSTRPTSEHFQQPFIVSTAAAEPHFALIKRQTQLAPAQMSYRSLDQSPAASGRSIPSKIYKRPSYLAPLSGLAFVTLFLALLVTLILLKIFITRNTGLSLPSTNSVGTQIIIIYIPVVISTLIEPYWTLLNRQLCVSQPLKELKACRATAAHSLNLSYSSVPPQFNVLRAARAKHYLLATICVIALVANVLSVGLGELLNAGIAMPENTVSLAAKTKPLLNATAPVDRIIDFRELFYVAHSILSAQTDPPAWTTKEAYFLPTSLDIDGDLLQDITIPTTGFSALSSCAEATVSNETYREDVISFSTTVITLTGDPVECYFSQIVNPVMYQDTEKHAAIDTLAPLIPSKADASAYERQTCASALAVVHVRGDRDETNKAALKPTSALHLICQPTLEASDSTVQVSRTDQVIASHHQTEAQSNVSAYLAPGYNITDLYVNLNTIIAWVVLLPGEDGELRSAKYQAQDGTRTALHNDAYAYTWFPYLLTKQLGSPDIVNASQPAPSAANIIPAVQELYRRLAALTFALGQDRFFPFPAAPDTVLPATYHTTETRVLMSDPMFYLCAAILLLDILAATAYYWRATPRRILPYAPTSLASMLSLYECSSLAPLQVLR